MTDTIQIELNNTEPSDYVSVEIKQPERLPEVHEAGVTSAMVATDQGKNPVEAYVKATLSQDINGMSEAWINSTREDRMQMLQNFSEFLPKEIIQKEAETYVNNMSGATVLGPYIEKIKSMPSASLMSEEKVNELALLAYHRQALSTFHPTGGFDTGLEIAGSIIPKRKTEAVIDVARKMGFIDGAADWIDFAIDPSDELKAMRNVALSLQGEEKAQYIKTVLEAVDKSSDNSLVKAEIMDAIFGGVGPTAWDSIFELLDLTIVAEGTSAVVKTGVYLNKSAKIINGFKKLNAPDSTADAVVTAVNNPEAAIKVGITPADTMDAVNPLIHEEIGYMLTGAPEDMAAQTNHMIQLQNSRFKAVTDNSPREGVIDRDRMEEVMRAAEIEQMKQPGVLETKIVSKDETGFKLEYKVGYFDEAGNVTTRTESKIVDFKIRDTGKLESPLDEYHTSWNRLDPNARMSGKLRNWYVSTVESIANIQAKTAFNFDQMMKDAYSTLSEKEAANVDRALQQGAKDGKVYTWAEMTNSGIGPNSVKLSPKEAQAYIGSRNVVNHMYSLKNKQIVDNYLALDVKLVDEFDGITPAKAYDDVAGAMTGWKNTDSDSLWVIVPGGDEGAENVMKFTKKDELTKEFLEQAYKADFVLVRNHATNHFFQTGAYRTQWALVQKSKVVSPRGQQVLNKIPGYMPKQRTNGHFFIKKTRTAALSGAKGDYKVHETVAWSDNAKSAEEWKDLQDKPEDYTIVFDRDLPPEQRSYEIAATHGGMYSGARKSTELPFVGSGNAEFADSFEALQHYINHIGRQYPASLYRLGSEERLLELAKSLGVKGAQGYHDVLPKAVASGLRETSKPYKLLQDVHNQVGFINMVPTDDELKFAQKLEDMGKALEQSILNKIPGWDKVPKTLYNMSSAKTHPSDIMRAITFHHMLGMYNPAQFIVQFSGAMVSFAVSPVKFAKALPRSIGWSQLDLLHTDPIAQSKAIKWMKDNGLGDYAEDYTLWTRSGFRENVIGGNADYTSVFMKNLPYDAGIVRKVMANHTLFYKMGELANTRTAFATAIERYKDTHKIKTINPYDDKVLAAISKDTEALRLNMSRANQSDLNKGWKSVPLQFQQVVGKYFEKILPKGFGGTDEFTASEKFRLAAVPMMATGFAGVPLGESIAVQLLSLIGKEESELPPDQMQSIKYGVVGWLAGVHGDINVDFATRMTLGADIYKNIQDLLVHQKATWEWLGPTGSIADRYFRNTQYVSEAFDLSVRKTDEINIDSMKFMASVLANAATDIPTLSRNYKQYVSYFFTQNPQFIKDGKYLFDFETMNKRTALFAIAGFAPTEMSEMYEIDKEIHDGRAAFSLFGDTDSDIILRILNTHILGTGVSTQEQAFGAQMVNSVLTKYGPMEATKIMDQVFQKAHNKRFDQGELYFQFLTESESRMQNGLDVLNVMIARQQEAFKGN